MKNHVVLTLALLTLFSLTGCSQAAPVSSQAQASETPTATVEKDDWTNYLSATVVEFSVSQAECSYSKGSLEAQVKFKNISNRAIAAIEAGGSVNNVFGETQMAIDLSESKRVEPGKSLNAGSWGNSCWSLNQFIPEQIGLLDMDPATMNLVVDVSKIAFEDGEILEF